MSWGPSRSNASDEVKRRDQDEDDDRGGVDRRYTTQKDLDRLKRDRLPQDHEIKDPFIMVIDQGSAPQGPVRTGHALSLLTPDESLRMIRPYVPAGSPSMDNGETAGGPLTIAQLALCKVVNKREEYQRQQELKAQRRPVAGEGEATAAVAKTGKGKTKELDMSWAISRHDLDTKLRQMGRFLARGMRVDLTIERKKGGRTATETEAAALLKSIREYAEENGGRLKGAPTGEPLRSVKMAIESKAS